MGKMKHTGSIDSPMQHKSAPALASAPGKYSEHPALGPAGVTGGMPLKFIDDAIKPTGVQATNSPQMVLPAAKRRS